MDLYIYINIFDSRTFGYVKDFIIDELNCSNNDLVCLHVGKTYLITIQPENSTTDIDIDNLHAFRVQDIRNGNPVRQVFSTDDKFYIASIREITLSTFNFDNWYETPCDDTCILFLYDPLSARRYIKIDKTGSGVGGREGDDFTFENFSCKQF